MAKYKNSLKKLALSVVLLEMLLPTSSLAQNDDFFRVNDNFYDNRDALTTWAIINNGIGQVETPLGSGLLVLSVAGVGYAIARRKRNLKKSATLLLAALMLLGLTNCRKNLETMNSIVSDGVYITLNVADGSKVNVNPTGGGTYATVELEDGDVIYVGNNRAYCGYLTYDIDTKTFGGTISPTSGDDGDYLHFYFMGNKGPVGSEPSSVSITDQTSKYPVISYGRSTSLYQKDKTAYSATLYNKCAIMKFTSADIDKVITITGMNNMVTVNFAANGTGAPINPYTYTKDGSGAIRLHAESNTVRWAILLPQDEVTTARAHANGYNTKDALTIQAVSANGYYDTSVNLTLEAGSRENAFTINSYGDQVFFSQGNLQYQASTNTWRFAEHQWDFVGDASKGSVYVNEVKSDNALISSSYTGWIDLFGWGTSGIAYTGHASAYQPWSTSTSEEQYNPYGSLYTNLYDGEGNARGKADWGAAANAVSLDGFTNWRTLKNDTDAEGNDEWQYVVKSRTTGKTVNGTTDANYTMATINKTALDDDTGVKGLILFPDSYNGPTVNIDNLITWGTINKASYWYNSTKCTTEGWAALEAAGCVFLPAAGSRLSGTSVSVGDYPSGSYWSSSKGVNNFRWGSLMNFQSGYVYPKSNSSRSNAYSVRLVRDCDQ